MFDDFLCHRTPLFYLRSLLTISFCMNPSHHLDKNCEDPSVYLTFAKCAPKSKHDILIPSLDLFSERDDNPLSQPSEAVTELIIEVTSNVTTIGSDKGTVFDNEFIRMSDGLLQSRHHLLKTPPAINEEPLVVTSTDAGTPVQLPLKNHRSRTFSNSINRAFTLSLPHSPSKNSNKKKICFDAKNSPDTLEQLLHKFDDEEAENFEERNVWTNIKPRSINSFQSILAHELGNLTQIQLSQILDNLKEESELINEQSTFLDNSEANDGCDKDNLIDDEKESLVRTLHLVPSSQNLPHNPFINRADYRATTALNATENAKLVYCSPAKKKPRRSVTFCVNDKNVEEKSLTCQSSINMSNSNSSLYIQYAQKDTTAASPNENNLSQLFDSFKMINSPMKLKNLNLLDVSKDDEKKLEEVICENETCKAMIDSSKVLTTPVKVSTSIETGSSILKTQSMKQRKRIQSVGNRDKSVKRPRVVHTFDFDYRESIEKKRFVANSKDESNPSLTSSPIIEENNLITPVKTIPCPFPNQFQLDCPVWCPLYGSLTLFCPARLCKLISSTSRFQWRVQQLHDNMERTILEKHLMPISILKPGDQVLWRRRSRNPVKAIFIAWTELKAKDDDYKSKESEKGKRLKAKGSLSINYTQLIRIQENETGMILTTKLKRLLLDQFTFSALFQNRWNKSKVAPTKLINHSSVLSSLRFELSGYEKAQHAHLVEQIENSGGVVATSIDDALSSLKFDILIMDICKRTAKLFLAISIGAFITHSRCLEQLIKQSKRQNSIKKLDTLLLDPSLLPELPSHNTDGLLLDALIDRDTKLPRRPQPRTFMCGKRVVLEGDARFIREWTPVINALGALITESKEEEAELIHVNRGTIDWLIESIINGRLVA